uniref:Calx-beta domain-containing protein n=1 Tax=Sphaerotilus montanus TaxID=522889 RepID=UPI003FA2AD5C
MAATQAPTLKSALLSGKAGLLQSLQRLTLDPNYVPARLPEGMVVGIWGDAVVRTPDGTVRELKVGEMVRKGYVILTSQNGIVQLEAEGDRLARVPVDRDGLEPTGTGLSGGEDGSLNGAERVGRVIEVVSPADFDFSAAERASNAAASVTGTGLAAPVASVADVTVKEDAGHAVFTVTLARSSDSATTLGLALTDGTAQGGGIDYGTAGTPQNLEVSLDNGATWTPATSVTIPAGMQSALVRTPITSDSTYEPDEGFTLTTTLLAGNVNVADPVGVATIVDQLPYIQAVNPVTVNEGAGQAVFTVALSNASKEPVTVRYTTADGTATGGADYTPVTGLITFAPGETSKTIAVPILNDTVYEGDETFKLTLSEPVNAGLPTPDVLGTIQDDGRGTGGTDDDRPRVGTVSSPAAREGEPLDFTITLTTTSTTPTVLDVTPRSGSGTVGTDTGPLEVSFDGGKTFTTVTDGKVTVPPGTDTLIVRVPTLPDSDPETSETIFLDVKAPADPAPVYGTGTIEDVPLVSIAGPAAVDEAIGNATYTVTLNHAATVPVSVTVKTVEGVALAGSDYTAVNQVLTFAPGETSKTVLVPITNDDVLEGKEAFTVQLAAPAGTVIDTAHASVLTEIADDGLLDDGVNKDAPKLAVTDLNLPETSGFAVFNVTLDKASGLATTVALALADGTAKGGGVDYGSAGAGNLQVSTDGGTTWTDATTVTFAAGKTSVLVRTPLVADALDDSGETFTLKATTTAPADGTSNASATGTATVYDLPTLRIDDQTVNEATGTATFTVTLSSASSTAVTVRYASVNDTATSGSDYGAVSGTLTFAPGELTRTISVPITDDLVYEGAETFKIQLTSPSVNALIADDTGIGTIMDDGTGTVPPGVTPTDDRPRATINDVIVNEGAGTATFTVTLAGTATTPITLGFATSDGTAKAGLDYSATTGTLTFAPGETSKSITVPILNDTVYEGSETFDVTLNNPSSNVVLGDPLGLGTIKDDGTGPVPPGVTPDDDRPLVTINDVLVNEGSKSAIFTVTLSNPSDLDATVKYTSIDGTGINKAEAGFDYEAVLGTLIFKPGDPLTQTISVPLKNDTVYEGAETFQIVLTDPTNARVALAGAGVDTTKDNTGIGTIMDDGTGTLVDPTPNDPPPAPDDDRPHVASVSNAIAPEGSPLDFTVTLSNASTSVTTVTLTLKDGSANITSDTPQQLLVSFDNGTSYTTTTGILSGTGISVSVPAGITSFLVRVPTSDDAVYEGSETLSLQAATPLDTAPVTGIGTITDVADLPKISINDPAAVNEGDGTNTVTFTVTLSNASTLPVTVAYTTADGTAKAGIGLDYESQSGILTFAAGETAKTITVAIRDDTVYEGPESFTVALSSPTNSVILDGSGIATIMDDGTGTLVDPTPNDP